MRWVRYTWGQKVYAPFTAGPGAYSARRKRMPLASTTPYPDFGEKFVNVRRRWRLDGRVQGVGFRAFSEELALSRGIRGWVRNEFDGSVSVEAEADVVVLSEFLQILQAGNLQVRVDHTEEVPLAPKNDPKETFVIR